MYFSSGSKDLPQVRGLNFNSKDAFLIETSAKRDSLTYWIKDTALVNNDSLEVEIKFLATDSTGALKEKVRYFTACSTPFLCQTLETSRTSTRDLEEETREVEEKRRAFRFDYA